MSRSQLSKTNSSLSILSPLRKYFGASIALFFIIFASGIFYATSAKTHYRAQILLAPPSEIDLQSLILSSLSIGRSKTPEIYDLTSVPAIFQAFKNNLASRAHQQAFLESKSEVIFGAPLIPTFLNTSADGFNKKVPGSDFAGLTVDWQMTDGEPSPIPWFIPRAIKKHFYPVLSINVDSDKQSSRTDLILSIDWVDPQVASVLADSFVQFINRKTVEQVQELVQTGNSIVQKSLEDYLGQKRKVAQAQIERKIKELDRAILIAQRLGILDPTSVFGEFNAVSITPPPQLFVHPNSEPHPFPGQRPQQFLPLFNPAHVYVEDSSYKVEGFTPPIYARGVRALEMEREILLTATTADDFIENIDGLLASLEWLEGIDVNLAKTNAAKVIRTSVPPIYHYGQSVGSILLMFAFIGLTAAIFLALLLYFFNHYRSEHPDS